MNFRVWFMKNSDLIFEGISLPPSLKKIIEMALEDGVLTEKERELIKRKAIAEGLEEIEFEFYFEKIEERFMASFHSQNSPSKILREAFAKMEALAEGAKGILPEDLMSQLSLLGSVNPAGMVAGTVATALNAFIKTPSNLNNLKAEVIRSLKIPSNLEIILEFLEYADSCIAEEKLKNKSAGAISGISNFLAGAEIDLIPIWNIKKKQIVEKAVEDFRNDPTALKHLKKYQTSSTDKLKKLLAATAGLPVKLSSIFMKIELPYSFNEFKELMDYVRQMSLSSDPRAPEFKQYLIHLQEEGQRRFPEESDEIASRAIKISALQNFKDKLKNASSKETLAQTDMPEDYIEFMELMRFVESKSKGSNKDSMYYMIFLGKMYDFGIEHFPDKQIEISSYRPRSIEILKQQLAAFKGSAQEEGILSNFKDTLIGKNNDYCNAIEVVLRNFPTPHNYEDLIEVLRHAKQSVEFDNEAKLPYIEFQNRLFNEALSKYPEKLQDFFPLRVNIVEKFKLYVKRHSIAEAVSSFPIPSNEEDFFDLIGYAKSKMKTDGLYEDEYKQMVNRLYTAGKDIYDSEKLKKYKIKKFGLF